MDFISKEELIKKIEKVKDKLKPSLVRKKEQLKGMVWLINNSKLIDKFLEPKEVKKLLKEIKKKYLKC